MCVCRGGGGNLYRIQDPETYTHKLTAICGWQRFGPQKTTYISHFTATLMASECKQINTKFNGDTSPEILFGGKRGAEAWVSDWPKCSLAFRNKLGPKRLPFHSFAP